MNSQLSQAITSYKIIEMSDRLSYSESFSYSAEYLEDSETDDFTHEKSEADHDCCEVCGVQIQGDEFSSFHPSPSALPQSSQLVVPGHRELFNDQDHYHPLLQRLDVPPPPSLPIQEESFDRRRSILVTGEQPRRVQEHLGERLLQELQDRPPLVNLTATVQQEQTPLGGGVHAEAVVPSHAPISSYQGALLLAPALTQTSFGVEERAELVLSSHVPMALSRPQRAQILTIRNQENRRQLQRHVPESQVPLQHAIVGLIELVHNSVGTFIWKIPGISELIRTKNKVFSQQFYMANGYMLKASIQVVPTRDPTEECVQFVVRITHKGNPLERPTRLSCCLLDQSVSELKQNVEASLTESSTSGHLVFEFKVVVQDRELLNASYVKDNKMNICFKIV